MTRTKTWLAITALLAAAILGGQTPTQQPPNRTIQVIVTPDRSAVAAPKASPQPAPQGAAGTADAVQRVVTPNPKAFEVTDVFVMPREAVLRERPSAKARIVGTVRGGERLRETAIAGGFLRVVRTGAEVEGEAAEGFVARDVVSVFPAGPRGTAELAAAGSAMAGTAAYRTLGVAMLERAAQRLRDEGTPDAALEVRLGESAEALIRQDGRWPAGVPRTFRACKASGRCPIYGGEAFARAYQLATAPDSHGLEAVRDRATAGLLRAKYPETSDALSTLWQETADWLALAESARDREALEAATERLGAAGLALGRDLLATGRLDQLDALRLRLISTSQRATSAAPGSGCGARLSGRAVILQAMRGDGSRAFPQEVRARAAGFERVVRVEGALGALTLAMRREGQGAPSPWTSIPATPVLPVPGSLRLSRDGRFAAWVEVVGPSRLLPVIARLDPPEPAREIAFLSSGRPMRDRSRENVMTRLDDFSDDGSRLGLSILAWDETPGPAARKFVVSSQDARIVTETDSARRQRRAMKAETH